VYVTKDSFSPQRHREHEEDQGFDVLNNRGQGERGMELGARHTVMWRSTSGDPSFEHSTLRRTGEGYELAGIILAACDGVPLRADYVIRCDTAWRTREVEVDQLLGDVRARLALRADGSGNWLLNGTEAPTLAGCIDADLEFSPSTNSLPIARVGFGVGERREIRAAWVRFPSLRVEAAWQAYERTGEERYRFRGLDTGFESEIEVDEAGLAVVYAGVWERVAEAGDGLAG
jgi:uncharacterized protein